MSNFKLVATAASFALSYASTTAPAAAAGPDFTFNVPVTLTNIDVTKVKVFSVRCVVYKTADSSLGIGMNEVEMPVTAPNMNTIVSVGVLADPASAKSYGCTLWLGTSSTTKTIVGQPGSNATGTATVTHSIP